MPTAYEERILFHILPAAKYFIIRRIISYRIAIFHYIQCFALIYFRFYAIIHLKDGDYVKRKLSKPTIICLCLFLVILLGILLLLWNCGAFVLDHSAKVHMEGMSWKGKDYSYIGGEYTEGRTIAKSKNGWSIKEVKEDPSHTFVVARSFLDQYLYVSDDYTVPTTGEITKVCWNGEYIEDKEFIQALTQIDSEKITSFDYETEAIFILNDNQRMKSLYFAYENCPVATVNKGWLGKIKGEWVITTYISSDQNNEDGSPKPYMVGCYSIPDKYSQILDKYFFE